MAGGTKGYSLKLGNSKTVCFYLRKKLFFIFFFNLKFLLLF